MKLLGKLLPSVNPVVFTASLIVVVAFLVLGAAFTEATAGAFQQIHSAILTNMGWFYILVTSFFLVFVIWLLLSKYGHIRLGDDDSRPEFGFFSWMAMLFSAGMGIGLVFWSIAEPIAHFTNPPFGAGGTLEAAEQARRITFFHWGLHAWAIYIIIGLSLAFFAYRKNLPLTIRSIFYPLLGQRIYGPAGHVIDTFAIYGTLFGIATSLGLGVLQINTGLNTLFGLTVSTTTQIVLISVISGIAIISVVTGIGKGVRILSEVNIWLSVILVVFLIIFGPTLFLINSFVDSVGDFAQNVVTMSLHTNSLGDQTWLNNWTLFYWAWWIAWSPFVGTFIARISRGRTIREFIIGTLFVPTLLTFVWLTVFGSTALHLEIFGPGGISEAVSQDVTIALYATLEHLPITPVVGGLATVLIATYFITSSDSGTYVINTLISGGDPDPPVVQRIMWGVLEGAVAAVLLLTGGLTALQTGTIIAALPFAAIMLVMCYSLVRGLRAEALAAQEAPTGDMGLPALTRQTLRGALNAIVQARRDFAGDYWGRGYRTVQSAIASGSDARQAVMLAVDETASIAQREGTPHWEAVSQVAQGALAAAELIRPEEVDTIREALSHEVPDAFLEETGDAPETAAGVSPDGSGTPPAPEPPEGDEDRRT